MSRTFRTSDTYAGIPVQSSIELPILQYLSNGKTRRFGGIYAEMVAHFKLPSELEGMTVCSAGGIHKLPASGNNVFYKYCNNACRSLAKKGDVLRDGGDYEDRDYTITEKGLKRVTSQGGLS